MSDMARVVLHAAQHWRERPFSKADYGASPYCASFVRWCYEQATGVRFGLPEVTRVPYYVRKGIHVAPGRWFADSLAGDAVGPVVDSQQPGDLLFFHDTAVGPWPVGSITHVGIAADAGERIYDAGSGSNVHFRSHRATFPGKLVEIRRPRALGSGAALAHRRTALTIARGQAFGQLHGAHARQMSVQFSSSTAPASALPGGAGGAGPTGGMAGGIGHGGAIHPISPPIRHSPSSGRSLDHTGRRHWTVMINDRVIKPHSAEVDIEFGSQRFKLFGHDHRAQAFLNGARANDSVVRVQLNNGAAHVWIDGKEVKVAHARIEIME